MDITILIGLIALIPVVFFLYDRFFRHKHKIHVEHGNIGFCRMVSNEKSRNDKLVLMVHGLKIVNVSKETYTLKEIALKYADKSGTKNEARDYNIPTGIIEEWQAIVITNVIDQVVIRWNSITEIISKHQTLQPGQIVGGSVLFILDAAVEQMRDLKELNIVIRDYSDNITVCAIVEIESLYTSVDKGFTVVDAPAYKKSDTIMWQGIKLGTMPNG